MNHDGGNGRYVDAPDTFKLCPDLVIDYDEVQALLAYSASSTQLFGHKDVAAPVRRWLLDTRCSGPSAVGQRQTPPAGLPLCRVDVTD
jgi:hypothetical protein